MANSELAESICTTYFNNTEGALLRDVVDAELQEVRDVLSRMQRLPHQAPPCWCIQWWADGKHDGVCVPAQQLWQKLVREG